MRCRWRKNQRISDKAFVEAWTAYVHSRAAQLVQAFNRPWHELDDYVSAGMFALAKVPKGMRWSAKYVHRAIQSKIWSELTTHQPRGLGLRDRTTRKQRRAPEFVSVETSTIRGVPIHDLLSTRDGFGATDARLEIEKLSRFLDETQLRIAQLAALGHSNREIAALLGSTLSRIEKERHKTAKIAREVSGQ